MQSALTPEEIEQDWLSLQVWMESCVLRVAACVIAGIAAAFVLGLRGEMLDVIAASLGVLGVATAGYQGIDVMTARLVHRNLLARSEARYRRHLAAVVNPPHRARDVFQLIDWIEQDLHP